MVAPFAPRGRAGVPPPSHVSYGADVLDPGGSPQGSRHVDRGGAPTLCQVPRRAVRLISAWRTSGLSVAKGADLPPIRLPARLAGAPRAETVDRRGRGRLRADVDATPNRTRGAATGPKEEP